MRLAWVDALKGMAIIMVVVYHLAMRFDAEVNPSGWAVWTLISEFFVPLRMPLFFFLSGLVVANAVGRGFSAMRKRFLGPAYLYLLWTLLFSLRLVPASYLGWVESLSLVDLVISLALPTTFWYIYALAIYFPVCCIIGRRDRRGVVVAGVAALSLAVIGGLSPEIGRNFVNWPWSSVQLPALMTNFVWYFLGVFGLAGWTRVSKVSSRWVVSSLALSYVALFAVQKALDAPPAIGTVLSGIGLASVAAAVPYLNLNGRISTVMQAIGKQSLPVYVFHIILISVLFEGIVRTPIGEIYSNNPGWLSLISVPVATVAVVLFTLWLGRNISTSRLAFLLNPPTTIIGRTQQRVVSAEQRD